MYVVLSAEEHECVCVCERVLECRLQVVDRASSKVLFATVFIDALLDASWP